MGSTPGFEGPEPIAVIGMGCRMPGNVRSPTGLWDLLMSKGVANTAKVPKSRFNIDAYLHPSNERPGSFNVPGGYFLEDDPQAFDHGMFNISPVEALWMDPQQRKLLEVVYEAFESSGTTLEGVAGQRTGCFVGSFTFDFQHMAQKEADFRHAYVSTGVDTGILGNRISYVFDLRGPSLTVNTACSSSLYALDLACKAIASGECDNAVVGGTNLILTVDQQMNTARLGVLSPTNQCHTFDQSADGYGRAEGVGALYIKPLSAALRNGDPIRAVIRSTATTSSGKSKDGMTHPSVDGQVDVIRSAYKMANLSPLHTSYVECHGTGTPVGDPIEVEAIHRSMGLFRPPSEPVLIGSIKPNVGHSEASSSMGTLIKTILALENGTIPPTAGVTQPSKGVPWEEKNVQVVTEPRFFPNTQPLRRVGVSAYGYGGTNAHAILESASSLVPTRFLQHKHMKHYKGTTNGVLPSSDADGDRPHLLLVSAHDEPTLKNRIADYASQCQSADLLDLSYTLGVRRSKLAQRAFAVVKKGSFERDLLESSSSISAPPTQPARIGFVFTGQGAQWPRMGSSLIQMYPSVLQTIRKLDRHLATLLVPPTWTVEGVLDEPQGTSKVNEPEFAQPLCTAIQIALVDLMARWNVVPLATLGHSSGEIGAAYAAGRISAEDAMTTAYFRGKVAASLRSDGAMLAVGLGASDAQQYVQDGPWQDRVTVACHNSPSAVTLSGDRDAIEELKEVFDDKKIFARVVKTGGKAYHSHHMREAAVRYEDYLHNETSHHESHRKRVPMFSTVRAEQLDDSCARLPDSYWVDNLNSPVLFDEGVQLMLETLPDTNVLVEIGPHPALAGPIRQICQGMGKSGVTHVSTLVRKEDDGVQMLRLAGALWVLDSDIDVEAVSRVESVSKRGSIEQRTGRLLVDLPTYHWTYSKHCWTESRQSREHRGMVEPRHDILGRRVLGVSPLEPIWRNVLRLKDLPWLAQHRLGDEFMMPGSGYLALAIEAITQVNAQSAQPLEVRSYTLRDVVISSATVVPDDDEGTETIFRLQPTDGKPEVSQNDVSSQWYHFVASCCAYGTWKETARGRIALNIRGRGQDHKHEALPDTPCRADHIDWMNKLRTVGFDLGPAFHHITNIYTNGKTHHARGDMAISATCPLMEAESRYVLHPTVLDSCLQPFLATIHQGRLDDMRCGTIPTHFGEATIYPPSARQLAEPCTLQVWTPQLGNRAFSSNSQLISHDGMLLADLSGCRNLLYGSAVPQDMEGPLQKDLFVKLDWKIDSDYLSWATQSAEFSDNSLVTAADALLHKNVAQQTLCLGQSVAKALLSVRPDADLTIAAYSQEESDRIHSEFADYDGVGPLMLDHNCEAQEKAGSFHLVLAQMSRDGQQASKLGSIRSLISDTGHLLLRAEPDASQWGRDLISAGFSGVDQTLPGAVILTAAANNAAIAVKETPTTPRHGLLVYRNSTTSLLSSVSRKLENNGWTVSSQPLGSIDEVAGRQVVLLADAEGPLLADLKKEELRGLIFLTENASAITWVTCGGLLTGDRPEFGMTAGAARVIRNEKGSLDLVTVDLDSEETTGERVTELLSDILDRQRANGRNGETEYYVKAGVVYVARLVSHREVNREFVPDSGEWSFSQANHPRLHASLENGQVIYRKDRTPDDEALGPDEVEVHVQAVGLSSSDGSDDSSYLSHEIAGEVTRVGEKVFNLFPGMKVFALAYSKLATFQRIPAYLVRQVPQDMPMGEAAALPSAFVAGAYGLEVLGQVEPDDYVGIMDGMGAVGLVAIDICRRRNAHAVVMTSSTETSDYLAHNGLLPSTRVISIHGDIPGQISRATRGGGLDVVMFSTESDHSRVSECCRGMATFGRIVSFGRSDQGSAPVQELADTGKSLSFAHFNLKDVVERRPRVVSRMLDECANLYRAAGLRHSNPIIVHPPAGVNGALRSISGQLGSGKHVLAYGNDTPFKVHGSRMPLRLRQDATYLMVGCLGGLGRQVALWMAGHGAKHLAFISRSGTDSSSASKTVKSLRDRGVNVLVLRADITKLDQVKAAVAGVGDDFPIRGMINAANVLHDSVFHNMSIGSWQAVTDTKVKGCLNLHHALKDRRLDFFVMTSSITSTLGSTGQSNYGAANSFLDSLARHRRSRGLAGVSLILPAILGIGYLAERPEIVKSIKSKGMYGIYENEMLEAFEIAMTPHDELPEGVDHLAVGIQPRRYGHAIKSSGAYVPWEEDPRLNWMAWAVQAQTGGSGGDAGTQSSVSQDIKTVIQQATSSEKALNSVIPVVTRRLARLLMIDEDSMQPTQKSVASYGLDSMIGAEFRNWIFRESQVSIPFQRLLAGNLTIVELAKLIVTETK